MDTKSLSHLIIILIAGGAIGYSGTKLAVYADWIGDRYKVGRVFIGAFLLAIATTLPELATTLTASWIGNAQLAINNLLGGINIQTAVLAVADLILIRGALTYFAPKATLVIGGIFVILQLAITILAMTLGEVFTVWNVGFWSILLFGLYLCMLYFILHQENNQKWTSKGSAPKMTMKLPTPPLRRFSNFRLMISFAIHTLIVLIAGWVIAYFADVLAQEWNWTGSWMGATLVALTTSLPEISTTFGAVRQKAYALAIANIFGSNALTISLLFLADLVYRSGSIINQADHSNILLMATGILLTATFLWGILERKNRTIFRMGYDSLIVLILFCFSLISLYKLSF
ncbi:MAG: hypothetical protein KDK64_05260 [Chlamydiia bacterium]|nr:hypothetical protein [Chlamydiia bacterium]